MEKVSVSLPFLFGKNISVRVLKLHQIRHGAVSYNRLDVSGGERQVIVNQGK